MLQRAFVTCLLPIAAYAMADASSIEGPARLVPTEHQVVFAGNAIGVLAGLVLLSRRDDQRCAVKLTSVKPNRSDGWDMEYEAYKSHVRHIVVGNIDVVTTTMVTDPRAFFIVQRGEHDELTQSIQGRLAGDRALMRRLSEEKEIRYSVPGADVRLATDGSK